MRLSEMVAHLRMFHGRKVTRQGLSGMVAHRRMFRAVLTRPGRPPLECSVWNALQAFQDGPPWNALSGMLCMRMRMRMVVCGGKLLEMTPNTGCLITLC